MLIEEFLYKMKTKLILIEDINDVIEFGDSYKVPPEETSKGPASESFAKKKGRIVAITTEDMQKRRNDVKARTTLLLALPDEHQLRFSKLQAIVSHLEFMDVEIEQDDLNQKFLTSLAPEWLIAKGEVYTASVPTASTQVSTVSTDVAAVSLSHDTICAYIATQSNGSQIKYKDITQIDEDDIEEMDIKWNMALLSMRADRFWKKTGKKITIQGSDVAGFDKSKLECFNYHKMGPFSRECRAPRSQDGGKRESYKQADDEVAIEFGLMAKSSSSSDYEEVKDQIRIRRVLDIRQLPPPAQIYSPLKKDLSWTGLREFVDDTITDYSRPTPGIDASKCNKVNSKVVIFSVFEHGESTGSIMSKPMIKFVKEVDYTRVIKINNTENARKSTVKYAEMYRNISKVPKVRGNQ
nr:hypothetical protein [Tanacetum cinerariifolium]